MCNPPTPISGACVRILPEVMTMVQCGVTMCRHETPWVAHIHPVTMRSLERPVCWVITAFIDSHLVTGAVIISGQFFNFIMSHCLGIFRPLLIVVTHCCILNLMTATSPLIFSCTCYSSTPLRKKIFTAVQILFLNTPYKRKYLLVLDAISKHPM